MGARAIEPMPRPRLCSSCNHLHGGRAYGICLEVVAGKVCPCNVVHISLVQHREERGVCRRTLIRRAAAAFKKLTVDERAKYRRAAFRFDEQEELTLSEYAVEAGLDFKLLWRMRRSLRLRAPGGGNLI